MHTRTADRRRWTVEDIREWLRGPIEVVIDGALAYWLEDDQGERLSPDSTRTIAPFGKALELHRLGADPDTIMLWARLDTGERYEVGGGVILIDMAESAVGIPPHQHTARHHSD
jgi:hypothetical protein